MTTNTAAFDPTVKGSRPSELGRIGEINAKITIKRKAIQQQSNQLGRVKPGQTATLNSGEKIPLAQFRRQRIATLKSEIEQLGEEKRRIRQPIRAGDTGRALGPGEDPQAFSTSTITRGSGNFDPSDPGTGAGQDFQIGTDESGSRKEVLAETRGLATYDVFDSEGILVGGTQDPDAIKAAFPNFTTRLRAEGDGTGGDGQEGPDKDPQVDPDDPTTAGEGIALSREELMAVLLGRSNPTARLTQKPPWWDDNVFGPFENFTPGQVQDIFQQAQDGLWGTGPGSIQERVQQFGAEEGQGETFQDPGTGQWFIRQPDGTIKLIPADQQPGRPIATPDVPSLDEQVADLIQKRQFDQAIQLQDFANRATPQERFQASLDFARSPADFFTISNIQAGTLPLPQSGTTETGREEVPGGDPIRALETLMREQGFSPDQIAVAQGQLRAALEQGMAPDQAFMATLGQGLGQELLGQFQGLTQSTFRTTQQVQRVGPQANFLQEAFGDVFGPQNFSAFAGIGAGGAAQPGTPINAADAASDDAGFGERTFETELGQSSGLFNVQFSDGQSATITQQQIDFLNANNRPVRVLGPATSNFSQTANLGGSFPQAAGLNGFSQTSSSGSIGPSGLLTTPRLENLIQGNPQRPARPVLPFAGLRALSPQQMRNSSPEELEMFNEIGRLAGIPTGTFQRELRSATPRGTSPGPIFSSGRRR